MTVVEELCSWDWCDVLDYTKSFHLDSCRKTRATNFCFEAKKQNNRPEGTFLSIVLNLLRRSKVFTYKHSAETRRMNFRARMGRYLKTLMVFIERPIGCRLQWDIPRFRHRSSKPHVLSTSRMSVNQSEMALQSLPDFQQWKEVLEECQENIKMKEEVVAKREKEVQEREYKMLSDLEEKEREMKERIEKELEEAKRTLAEEKQEWEEEKEKVKKTKTFEKIVTLNVGGTKYTTSLSTLTKYPDSMLGVMFSGRHALPQQEDGSYFIDFDGEYFRYILSYLRDRNCGIHNLSKLTAGDCGDVKYLSHYFQLQELETFASIKERNKQKGQTALSLAVSQIQENPIYGYNEDYGYEIPLADYNYGGSSMVTTSTVTSRRYDVDYEVEIQNKTLTCTLTCRENYQGSDIQAKNYQNAEFKGKIEQCNLTDVQFLHCHFGEGFSFEGSILHNTVFEYCSGLVTNKVHFAPWQVAQAKFQPELLKALKAHGCVY